MRGWSGPPAECGDSAIRAVRTLSSGPQVTISSRDHLVTSSCERLSMSAWIRALAHRVPIAPHKPQKPHKPDVVLLPSAPIRSRPLPALTPSTGRLEITGNDCRIGEPGRICRGPATEATDLSVCEVASPQTRREADGKVTSRTVLLPTSVMEEILLLRSQSSSSPSPLSLSSSSPSR